ncbi:hypothetical protein NGF19_02080 [Streptomyces sp. RY43-2]|uniref:Integral membrane protein n=1 Tax=Streptomyces macrolidinus TaxID=2952607 RepID=A0ABT0Z9T3_9ACTN|nr:hypothetical protein [Streptomyces macrolidinus]MCN9239581.1 hypothetical protein [Streptomyces macrolidinus]
MRRTARLVTGTALAVAAGGMAVPAYGEGAGSLAVLPSSAVPGTRVTVTTAACGAGGTAMGNASAVGAGMFTLAPGSPGKDASGHFRVPPSAQPGTYEIVATCSGGEHATVTGDLTVTLTPAGSATQPRGSVKTGVGGAFGADPVQTAVGVAALAVAAASGTWLLHRRARRDRS